MNKKWNDIIERILNDEIALGDKKLEQFREHYGRDTHFFILMYSGTGDMFYVGMYLKDYCERNKIGMPCVLVVGEHIKRTADLFEGFYVEIITPEERKAIEKCRILDQDILIHLLHYDTPYFRKNICINGKLRGVHGINFLDMFLTTIFGDYKQLSVQNPGYDQKRADHLIKSIGLKRGKSVILSPYANSMPQITPLFWKTLTKRLLDMGYDVYTNVSPVEMEVDGSRRLEMPFDITVPVLEFAGNYIGIRSGFTDIISMSKSKKIILYPTYLLKGNSDSLECYSLVKLGLDSNAREIVYDEKKTEQNSYIYKLLENVLENVLENR